MSIYTQKVRPASQAISELINNLVESNSDIVHDIRYKLLDIEDLIDNPFQKVPTERFIHITTSFCDPDGSAYKSHDDDISFEREISAANLYIELKAHVEYYDPEYKLNLNIQDLENWLMQQTALLRTVRGNDFGCVEDTGTTVGDFKTKYGSIDFFIEYGISFPEEIYNGK